MWLGNSMARYGIKEFNTLLTGDNKIPVYYEEEKIYKGVPGPKLLNNTAYNQLIIAQEYTVCFQIAKEAKKKYNKYGNKRQAWMTVLRKIDPTTGDYKTKI